MAGQHNGPGFGTALCLGLPGKRCGSVEVEGLEYCIQHMPDELLEEAEEITGIYRCRHGFGQPDACRNYAVAGSLPPQCKVHGGNAGSTQRQHGALRLINGEADRRAAELIGEVTITGRPVEDPYAELMQLAGEMRDWKDLLRQRVHVLQIAQYRYQGKAGEQVRGEIVLYERAMERLGQMLVAIAKLNLDARLVGIRQQTLDMLDRALTLALTRAQVPPEKISEARETFRQHIKIAS